MLAKIASNMAERHWGHNDSPWSWAGWAPSPGSPDCGRPRSPCRPAPCRTGWAALPPGKWSAALVQVRPERERKINVSEWAHHKPKRQTVLQVNLKYSKIGWNRLCSHSLERSKGQSGGGITSTVKWLLPKWQGKELKTAYTKVALICVVVVFWRYIPLIPNHHVLERVKYSFIWVITSLYAVYLFCV